MSTHPAQTPLPDVLIVIKRQRAAPPRNTKMDHTEQALAKLNRQAEVAKRDGGTASTRGVKISIQKDGQSRYMYKGQRVSQNQAVAIVAQALAEEAAAPKPGTPTRTNFDFYKLNHHTQLLFWELCEQIQTVTKDASNSVAVRLGHDIPKIVPQHQPRLTNLKKAGVLKSYNGTTKSHKMLVLTEAGQKIWNSGKA